MWKKHDEPEQANRKPADAASAEPVRRKVSGEIAQSVVGNGLRFEGSITGDGDLTVQGEISGEIALPRNAVTVGKDGNVTADIEARIVKIEGQVTGDISGIEQVVVHSSGSVRGNVKAPRVTVEDGAKVKGSIDTVQEAAPAPAEPAVYPSKDEKARAKSANDKEAAPQPSVLPSSH